jgi:CHAD domain
MMTTKRTAIRGRLAVRRAANRPPWGARKTGHGSIVTPLAATVAATLVATVAVRVGMARAKIERDRRSARVRRAGDRQFALLGGERPADGCRRMALAQLDLAIELLEGEGKAMPTEDAIHELRKALKRLRALMRLLSRELGETAFARENAVLRNAGLRLAGARDAEVLVGTLEGLVRAHPKKLARRRGVVKLRRQLVAERDRAAQRTHDGILARAEVLGELRELRGRVEGWSLPHREGIKTVEPGLLRIYQQGRRRHLRAARGKGDRGLAMHQWRKRVKDLRHAGEMLDRKRPAGDEDAGGGRRRRRRRRRGQRRKQEQPIRRLARRADELGELLGEEHDLALLAERLRAGGTRGKENRLEIGRGTRTILLKLIARRRRRLRRRVLREGERLYRRTPKRFVRRVGAAYARALSV